MPRQHSKMFTHCRREIIRLWKTLSLHHEGLQFTWYINQRLPDSRILRVEDIEERIHLAGCKSYPIDMEIWSGTHMFLYLSCRVRFGKERPVPYNGVTVYFGL